MFPFLDAAAGMAFVYLLLSLICSAIREAGEILALKRPAALRSGLNRLVGPETARMLFDHPLLSALVDHPGGAAYIPPRIFSTALLDLTRDDTSIPERLKQALQALEAGAKDDRILLQAAIENWFNSSMDAVSRAYRRHTHMWLVLIGIFVTIAMNADSIRMTGALLDNPTLRAAAAQAGGETAVRSLPGAREAAADLRSLGMPIGWPGRTCDNALPWKQPWTGPWWHNTRLLIQWHWAGWLLTVAAISLGAPFWFDLLKRVPPVRSS